MPPIKKTKEISQESCQKSLMLIKVFTFLNNNFDMWYKNNHGACIKAKEATSIIWDANTTYKIVNICIEAMKEYMRTGNKSNACSIIIWNNEKLNGLIRKFYLRITKRKKEEKEPCQKSLMLIKVFTFLNNNFDMWYKNNHGACIKAKEATSIIWDANATFKIVNSCIEAIKEYMRTGNKSTDCSTIIWNNEKLNGLIRKFYHKITKRKKEEKQKTMINRRNEDGIENVLSTTDQIVTEEFASRKDTSFSIEAAINLYDRKIKNVNYMAARSQEMIEDSRKKQVEEISRIWSKLEKTIEDERNKINKIYEKLNKIQ